MDHVKKLILLGVVISQLCPGRLLQQRPHFGTGNCCLPRTPCKDLPYSFHPPFLLRECYIVKLLPSSRHLSSCLTTRPFDYRLISTVTGTLLYLPSLAFLSFSRSHEAINSYLQFAFVSRPYVRSYIIKLCPNNPSSFGGILADTHNFCACGNRHGGNTAQDAYVSTSMTWQLQGYRN